MPTLNINGNIRTNTTAGWTADATVYTAKTILVTTDATYGATDQRKFKIADGVQTWANLNYFPISGYDDATSSIQTQLDDKVYAVDIGNITNWSIVDLTTYYMGLSASVGTTTDQISFVPLYEGTIVAIITEVFSAGIVGSNTEDGTLTLFYNGGGSSTVIASDFKMGANRHFQRNFTGLSISIPTGAAYLKFDSPLYGTNPNAIQLRVTLLIRP